ncbi:MAG: hypothetical protein EZS28_022027 [Streblomastix strix]|uniref:Uncharacterized protein n=1 Tax=Streblomastix strix TaxID=222440 RepID=A0A5J4VJJ7_9EUKA|nr:MAG: hypothetical protein EZS28_022027 [Streblomastix strix]
MCAITYLLPISGKSIPSIKLHLSKKRQCLRYVNSPYPNTCVLEAIARYQLKDRKEKRYNDNQVLHKMKEIGDDSSFRYYLAQSFPIPTELAATQLLESANEINLLLIQSEELNGINIHTLLVTDKERLTEAVQIKHDNNYDDELIPYSIEVPILGYNSANPHQTEQIIPYLIVRIMLDNAAYIVTRSKVIVTIKR